MAVAARCEERGGFLIVKRFHRLHREYAPRYDLRRAHYGMPRVDLPPEAHSIKYRGLDRDAVGERGTPPAAEALLGELENAGRASEGFTFDATDAARLLDSLGTERDEYEVIWARVAGTPDVAPVGFISIGFEPTYFGGDHFSASCDCMLIPRWHGTDEDGSLFAEHFVRLTADGLFPTAAEARAFLEYYLSFDWTETGEYEIGEVFVSSSQA